MRADYRFVQLYESCKCYWLIAPLHGISLLLKLIPDRALEHAELLGESHRGGSTLILRDLENHPEPVSERYSGLVEDSASSHGGLLATDRTLEQSAILQSIAKVMSAIRTNETL